MQTIETYNAFCASLPGSTHVVQWGGAHVWKVGGKVFAIAGLHPESGFFVTFKASEMSYEILAAAPGLRPAPYLASRGLKWLQRVDASSMDDTALAEYVRQSYQMVAEKLPAKRRAELGLDA